MEFLFILFWISSNGIASFWVTHVNIRNDIGLLSQDADQGCWQKLDCA